MAVRFGTVAKVSNSGRARDTWTFVTLRSMRHLLGGAACATVTQLEEIDCREVWRELVNRTEGDLTPEMRDRVERHLQSCPQCRAVYDGSRNIVQLLGDKTIFELPRGFSQRLYKRLSSLR